MQTDNPHEKSAYLRKDITTSELIDRLAVFPRCALDKSTTTLREKIQSVQDYFFLQKRRFGDQILKVSIGEIEAAGKAASASEARLPSGGGHSGRQCR